MEKSSTSSGSTKDGSASDKVAGRLIDEAIESLRTSRQHLQELKTTQTLRLVQLKLGYVALALDWEMDGETAKANEALRLAEGRAPQPTFFDPHNPVFDPWNVDH